MKYVYKIIAGGAHIVIDQDQLNRHGQDGWELVTILDRPHYQLVFKRAVPGPPDAVQKIRDFVQRELERHEHASGAKTGEDACSGILFFIDNDLDA